MGLKYLLDHSLTCIWTDYLLKLKSRDRFYRAYHGFGHAKFPDDGSVLSSSQFSILPPSQLPPKILLDSKVVKIDTKISLC